MTQPRETAAEAAPQTPEARQPAAALADVWDLLDVLPAAEASADMMATTVEMAAVSAAGAPAGIAAHGPSGWSAARHWLPAAAIVVAALVAGLAAGRATAPNPDLGVLGILPIAEHVDLLREAGSVAFLDELAQRGYPPPRRLPLAQSPADVRADGEEFDAAIAALRTIDPDGGSRASLAARRDQVLALSDPARRQLEKSVEAYQRLSAADRRELSVLARALAEPGREKLVQAARLWHQWIQLRDPADRRDVIDLGTADRLEWLDRWTRLDARNEGRGEMRENARQMFEREWENRRRPGPDGRPGLGAGLDGRPPPDFRRDEGPRPPRPRGPEFKGREPRPPGENRPPPG